MQICLPRGEATPVIAGAILLMQEYHFKLTNTLPSVKNLETWLRNGGVTINDGDDEADNVTNTGLNFIRVDVVNSLENERRHLQRLMLHEQKELKAIYAD